MNRFGDFAQEVDVVNTESNPNVLEAQRILNVLGYGIPESGVADDMTNMAIAQFQEQHGIELTGRVDEGTIKTMRLIISDMQGEIPSIGMRPRVEGSPQPTIGIPGRTPAQSPQPTIGIPGRNTGVVPPRIIKGGAAAVQATKPAMGSSWPWWKIALIAAGGLVVISMLSDSSSGSMSGHQKKRKCARSPDTDAFDKGAPVTALEAA